jgi:hypothetical protein
MTSIPDHVMAVRANRKVGMDRLVNALLTDPDFLQDVRQTIARVDELERSNPERLKTAWIEKTTRETLSAALAAAKI